MDVDVVFQSPEVLDVHSVVAGPVSGGLVGHAELCDEPWVTRALTLKQTPVSVPLHNLPIIIVTITINIEYHHHLLHHGGEEPPVYARLVLCAAGHVVGDVKTYSIFSCLRRAITLSTCSLCLFSSSWIKNYEASFKNVIIEFT